MPAALGEKLRLMLVAPTKPGEGNGGAIVLDRHLCHDPQLELFAAEPDPPPTGWLRRLRNSRFSHLVNDLTELRPMRATKADLAAARAFRPHALVTVAHGREYRRALGLARATGLPLLSFFHDHWPSMISLSPLGRRAALHGFARLSRESTALCVSDAMLKAIGNPATGRVLLPIPGAGSAFGERAAADELTVAYSGNLYDYGPPMGAIAELLVSDPHVSLTIRGPNPQWSAERLARLTAAGVYQPPLDRADYEAWMAQQDAHLCVLSFDPRLDLRMRTSFPSKMLEMFRFGRPVVLWGPPNAAGVAWAREHDAALVVDSADPAALATALRRLASEPELYAHYRESARRAAALTANATIHAQFRAFLAEALDRGA